jgi:hypothetical protein
MEAGLASNIYLYESTAQKYYKIYKDTSKKVEELKQLFVGVKIDIDKQTGEFVVPEHLKSNFDDIRKLGTIVTESAFIAVLFEAFAVEAYVNNIANFFKEGEIQVKDADTVAKYLVMYKKIAGTDMPKDMAARKKIIKLFHLRGNLVHSKSVPFDWKNFDDVLNQLYGDGKNRLFDIIDYVISTYVECHAAISAAAEFMQLANESDTKDERE